MALSYLETLANLPWSTLSHQLCQEQVAVVASRGRAGPAGNTASTNTQQAQQEGSGGAMPDVPAVPAVPLPGISLPGCELPLGAVRAALDEAHYGLDKIKERIVQYVAVQRLR